MSDLHTSGRWKAMQKACRLRDMRANARCGICGRPIDYDLPQEVIDRTIAKYEEAYELLTGEKI